MKNDHSGMSALLGWLLEWIYSCGLFLCSTQFHGLMVLQTPTVFHQSKH